MPNYMQYVNIDVPQDRSMIGQVEQWLPEQPASVNRSSMAFFPQRREIFKSEFFFEETRDEDAVAQPTSREPAVSRENDKPWLQVERLRTMLTLERRASARESEQTNRLLRRIKRLERRIDNLTTLVRWNGQSESHPSPAALRKFYRLATIWKTTTIHVANITEKCSHPAYQQIIAMGPSVLPLVFDELRREPDDWFVALRTLTRADPVPSHSRSDFDEAVEAWLEWGGQHGYLERDGLEK